MLHGYLYLFQFMQHSNSLQAGLPAPLLHSIEFAILLHDSLGESGDDNVRLYALFIKLVISFINFQYRW